MGKQTTPRAIAELPDGSLARRDAVELYAETPKRVLFDALYRVLSDQGNGNAYDTNVEMSALIRLAEISPTRGR